MKVIVLSLVALLGFAAATKNYEGYKIYRFSTTNSSHLDFLKVLEKQRHYDFLTPINRVGKSIDLMVSPKSTRSIENWFKFKNIDYKIINSNVESSLKHERDALNAKRQNKINGRITFDQYYRHDEINAYLDEVAKNYSDLVTLSTAGKSFQGRDMNILTISTGKGEEPKPVIFVDAGIHAREWIAPSVALYLINQLVENDANADLIADVDWVILPSVNPDGYEFTWDEDRMWRKTVSTGSICDGADANRNFGYHWMESGADDFECSDIYAGSKAFSEKEAVNLRDYLATLENVKAYITLHSCGQYLLYPWGYGPVLADNADQLEEVGDLINDAIKAVRGTEYYVGNSAIALYPAAGASDDWARSTGIEIVFTQELPCGDSYYGFGMDEDEILPTVEETFEGFKALHKYVVETYGKK